MTMSARATALACVVLLTIALAGCSGSSDSSDSPPAKATSEPAAAPETTEAPAEPTGTFTVSGSMKGQGPLDDVVCVPVDGGTMVTAAFSASGRSGTLKVSSEPAPDDHERGDSFTVKGDKILMYTRISADSLPYSIEDDGSTVTGSVTLAEMGDIAKPLRDRKQVTLAVDIDCG